MSLLQVVREQITLSIIPFGFLLTTNNLPVPHKPNSQHDRKASA
jgi:hypothetical protein